MRRAPTRRAVRGAACLVLVALAAGCSGSGSGSGKDPAEDKTAPQPQQAYAVAQKEFGLLAGGGWAQAWKLWADGARQSVPQADFVRVNTECRPLLGVPYVIDDSTVTDPTTVRITWHRGTAKGTDTVLYQAGQWRFMPDAGTLADYRLGADQLVKRRKAAGSCH